MSILTPWPRDGEHHVVIHTPESHALTPVNGLGYVIVGQVLEWGNKLVVKV